MTYCMMLVTSIMELQHAGDFMPAAVHTYLCSECICKALHLLQWSLKLTQTALSKLQLQFSFNDSPTN